MRRGAGTCGISTRPEPWLTVANTSGPGSPAAVPARRAAGTPGRVGGGSERISDLVRFFKGADKELLPKMVNTLLNLKLSETEMASTSLYWIYLKTFLSSSSHPWWERERKKHAASL